MNTRLSGILLHITSLPSKYGIGDLGPRAFEFADFLESSGQRLWQILPLNPTETAFGNSPYSSFSSFAGNPLLISPELLYKERLISKKDIDSYPRLPQGSCDYPGVVAGKQRLFDAAFKAFMGKKDTKEFDRFCSEQSGWLEDFALFIALKRRFKQLSWNRWPGEYRNRDKAALSKEKKDQREAVTKEKFLQFLFFKQWFALRNYCNQKQVRFIGDMPIYVSMDSVDVWVHRDLFKLDKDGYPSVVAGVPPDYFSKTGQRWGNPVYNWDALKKTGYDWWIRRIAHSLKLSDIVRIDHFRGFVDFWEIPAGEETAVNGSWAKAPADDFFTTLMNKMPDMPIIAEDLGYLSDDARNAIKKFNLPGMRLMIFAFGEDNPNHPYLPGNFIENCIGYTGTHDNNTIRGWFENEAAAQEKERALKYLKRKTAPKNIAWEFVKCVMASRANTVIMPVQDILGLGREARMNIPSRPEGNWEWRLLPGQVDPAVAKKLFDITKASNRG